MTYVVNVGFTLIHICHTWQLNAHLYFHWRAKRRVYNVYVYSIHSVGWYFRFFIQGCWNKPTWYPCVLLSLGMSATHYTDVIMSLMASQITSFTIVYSPVCSGTDQRKHQSSASLAFVRWIHRGPVNSPHKSPVTRKMFPFDDVIMCWEICLDIPFFFSTYHSL